jgi:transcriptional regulator with GAF, ATPase, and Fis domain
MESEFFGHEKGSFTGATEQRDGRFELANGGTILLDEISEISLSLQAKLLRVLQEKEFERVGGNKTIKVDVRVVATTNRDLLKTVEKGDFREDLYYRLNVFPIHVPPLRERAGDIELLAKRFLERFERQNGTRSGGFSQAGMTALLMHHWPGNVRELQNVVERAAILAEEGKPIGLDLLGLGRPIPSETRPVGNAATMEFAGIEEGDVLPLHEVEKRCIFEALERTGGNRTHAAALLKISIRTLRNKLAEYRGEPVEADA